MQPPGISGQSVAVSQADREAYVGRLKGFVVSIEGMVSSEACDHAMHLIDHGEGPEGMHSLAWSIVTEERHVPSWVIDALRELAGGLVPQDHWPPDLDAHAERA